MKQSPEVDGPHQLPYRDQEQCAVEGRCIYGGYTCTVVAIRHQQGHCWVLYPHGVAGRLGVLITDDAARTLAKTIGRPS